MLSGTCLDGEEVGNEGRRGMVGSCGEVLTLEGGLALDALSPLMEGSKGAGRGGEGREEDVLSGAEEGGLDRDEKGSAMAEMLAEHG